MTDAELVELSQRWTREFGDLRPEADLLRSAIPERWVRFHSLPESKRYPENEAEYGELLRRHHILLGDLADATHHRVVATVTGFSDDESGPQLPKEIERVLPDARHWKALEPDDWNEGWLHVFAGWTTIGTGLDPLLRMVADWQVVGVMLASSDWSWIYHPYDGGSDVIASSTQRRDEIRARHADWLSNHPSGL